MSSTAYVPFSEPSYIVGLPSPYYKETHLRWQKACRKFVDDNLLEKALEWDTAETIPEHVFETFAKHGMLLPTLPAPLPAEWLKKLGIHDILGVVKVEEWDYIHTMIYADEVRVYTLCPTRVTSNTDTVLDGSHWSRRPRRLTDYRHVIRCPAYHQVRQQAAPGAIPPRSLDRQEADLHCHYRAGSRIRRREHHYHRYKDT
jgi:hypothetical protein